MSDSKNIIQYSKGFCYPDVVKTAEYICKEIQRNAEGEVVQSIRMARHENSVSAYRQWAGKVGPGKDWDHKEMILTRVQGGNQWACDRITHLKFYFDIWSNIHYGFIGRCIGFSELELTSGAGYAQFRGNTMTIREWAARYKSNFREGGIIGALDDPCDTQDVKVGYSLYNEFGTNISELTANAILKELYKFIKNGKPLSIEQCGHICERCGCIKAF